MSCRGTVQWAVGRLGSWTVAELETVTHRVLGRLSPCLRYGVAWDREDPGPATKPSELALAAGPLAMGLQLSPLGLPKS